MKKEVTLYNLIFPLWVAVFLPPFILIPLIGNLFIDGIVLAISLKIWGEIIQWDSFRKIVLKAWGIGFLADIVGALLLFILTMITGASLEQYNPWKNIISILAYVLVIFMAGGLIAFLNYKILCKVYVDHLICKKVSIVMGVITAPWMFLIPTTLFM